MDTLTAILEKIGYMIVVVLFLAIILGAAMAFPLMWCWNYVMPYLFGFKTITWLHAWCALIIANLLVKSNNINKGE